LQLEDILYIITFFNLKITLLTKLIFHIYHGMIYYSDYSPKKEIIITLGRLVLYVSFLNKSLYKKWEYIFFDFWLEWLFLEFLNHILFLKLSVILAISIIYCSSIIAFIFVFCFISIINITFIIPNIRINSIWRIHINIITFRNIRYVE